ncbi:MAG: S-methyl-5-thioribose-1-phosphate isomerase [Candidatus Omnitrophica bacterium]|nr:S-methyl-5-thioribose-1-phosphate isomerase [Candidatus Omnitrophota bacterium]
MIYQTIAFKNQAVRLVDQSVLPNTFRYIWCYDLQSLVSAIKKLKVRGAPALGAAAALGLYLGIKDSCAKNFFEFLKELNYAKRLISHARPTARNLFWGIERVWRAVLNNKGCSPKELKKIVLKEAVKIIEEDKLVCRKIAENGERLIADEARVLTICNTGALATIDYGTALGILFRAKEKKKNFSVFACETRPLLQGARLTTWELKQKAIDVTLICDNMAATLMKNKKIDCVLVGADRIAANGDTANKIGTYMLAVLAYYHGIAFYVAAPCSTFDLNCSEGKDIPIEERPAEEVTTLFFKKPMAVKGIKVFNPAFDITDAKFIKAFITEKGIIRPPYTRNIRKILFGK